MVAVIIPYRDRLPALRRLLPALSRYLPLDQVYLAEQLDDGPFNKGMLINAMYASVPATAMAKTTDVIIHDVDMIPVVWDITPCKTLAHLASRISEWTVNGAWGLPYHNYCGGSLMINCAAYRVLNGFENTYCGWGCEDDDFIYQFLTLGLQLKLLTYAEAKVGYFERRLGVLYHVPHQKSTNQMFKRNQEILKRRTRERYAQTGHSGLKEQSAALVNVTTFGGCWHYQYTLPRVDIP